MTDDAGREEDDGPPGEDAETLPTESMDEEGEEAPPAAAVVDEGDQGDEETAERSPLAVAGSAVAWVAGVVLIGFGILGMAGGGPGILPLVLGLVVTPRTRRELRELCRMLCGAGG